MRRVVVDFSEQRVVPHVLGILVSADAAKAGPSTADRNLPVTVDQVAFTDEATQQTEDQIGLDKRARRNVQRSADRSRLRHQGQRKVRRVRPAPPSRAGRRHAVIPRPASSTRSQHEALLADTRLGGARRARAAATMPVTAIQPIVAARVVLTITAAVAVQAA